MPSPTTVRDLCSDACIELGVLAMGETLNASTADAMRRLLERLLNNWNAEGWAVYATTFSTFTLTPSLSPHTIGTSAATFTVTQRPVEITDISLILPGGSPPVLVSLTQRDEQWYTAQTVPGIETDIPTDYFYDPGWPNGEIYFWPVPSAASDVRLTLRIVLDDTITLNDVITLPPGYQDAITMTLAEMAAPSFGAAALPAMPIILERARTCRARIFANNDVTPRLATRDAGMQGPNTGSSGVRSAFNWLIGTDVR